MGSNYNHVLYAALRIKSAQVFYNDSNSRKQQERRKRKVCTERSRVTLGVFFVYNVKQAVLVEHDSVPSIRVTARLHDI